MTDVFNYPDIYMSGEGKQMIENTKVTLEKDSALIEVERREVGVGEAEDFFEELKKEDAKSLAAKFAHSRLSHKQRGGLQHA